MTGASRGWGSAWRWSGPARCSPQPPSFWKRSWVSPPRPDGPPKQEEVLRHGDLDKSPLSSACHLERSLIKWRNELVTNEVQEPSALDLQLFWEGAGVASDGGTVCPTPSRPLCGPAWREGGLRGGGVGVSSPPGLGRLRHR